MFLVFSILMASAASAVTVVVTASAAVAAASTVMSVASAATACVYVLSVEAFSEFLLCSLAYCKDLACEVEGLACHLVVEVHLY